MRMDDLVIYSTVRISSLIMRTVYNIVSSLTHTYCVVHTYTLFCIGRRTNTRTRGVSVAIEIFGQHKQN